MGILNIFKEKGHISRSCVTQIIWLNLKKDITMGKLFHLALKEGILLNPGSIYDFRKNSVLRLLYSYVAEKDIMDRTGLRNCPV